MLARPDQIRPISRKANWEDVAVVIETHRLHVGHELVIEERLRLAEGETKLVYVHWISGPDGTPDRREITFAVGNT
jgi:hypothetical protein